MRRVMAAAAVGGALLLAGCSSAASSGATTSATAGSSSTGAGNANNAGGSVTVRLGFLTNITHAPALVGLKEGYFAQALGNAGTLKPTAFASGTQETTALLAGQLDAAYVGPNPTINAWQKSGGTAIKVISGAATGGGDVFVKPTTPNSAAVLEFQSGQIAGGSEPAPYDVQMVKDGGTVLLSETGVTTLLVVTQSFLAAHPAVVADLLKAQVQANDFIAKNAAAAQADVNTELASYTGKPLKPSIVAASFKEITFTDDPDQSSLTADATQATSLGLLKPVTLTGLFDLGPLNSALTAAGEQTVGS